jgi:hypothetical protein
MLALHLLQICLVYINTLMIQRVLTEPDWTPSSSASAPRTALPLPIPRLAPVTTTILSSNNFCFIPRLVSFHSLAQIFLRK